MLITLSEWKTVGLRCPDTEVSFIRDGKHKRINLIQMPNGTGKSTIIELISSTLNGTIKHWSSDKVKGFCSVDTPVDQGLFLLKIQLEDNALDSKKIIVFQIDFDFLTGSVSISTIQDQTVGLEEGWNIPRELLTFFNDRCVEVFVFKGDKVRHLIENGRNDAEESIKAFFGLSHVDDLIDIIEEDFKGRQSGVSTSDGFSRRKNVLDKWLAWLDKLIDKEKELKKHLKPIRAKYDDIKTTVEEIMAGQNDNSKILSELETEKESSKQDLSVHTFEAFDAIQNPFFISDKISQGMLNLKGNLDRLKLPGTSGEFFKELSSHDICICNRPIDENSKAAILENAKTFLSDDHVEIINGIKRDTDTYSTQAKEQKSADPFNALKEAARRYNLSESKLQRHNNKMKGAASPHEQNILERYEEISKEKDSIEQKLDFIQNDTGSITQISSGNPDQCKKIPIVKKVIELRQKELAEISNTVQEFDSKEKLKRIFSEASALALTNIKQELKEQSNIKLKRILPKGTPLEILDIDKHIQLGFEGRTQTSASGGQNVSVAYSFATSILEKSGAQFPLIVDHPVTALQESARRGLGENLAEICHQFIGFIIDTEKTGFVDALQGTEEDALYITLFKKITGNEPYIDLLPEDDSLYVHSSNGVVCTSREFFNNFKDLTPEMSE